MFILSEQDIFSYDSGNKAPVPEDMVFNAPAPGEISFEPLKEEDDNKTEEVSREAPKQKKEFRREKITTEKKREDMSKTKTKKKKGGLVKVIAAVLALVIVAGALFVFGVIPAPGGVTSNRYTVDSAENLIKYLKHPALCSGDTIEITADMTVDINESFGGYAVLPLVSYDCGGNSLSFTGGTAVLLGGSSKATMDGVSFSDCKLYVEAPATALVWSNYTDDSGINARSLNGTAHKQELGLTLAGAKLKVPVTVTNVSDSVVKGSEVKFTSENFIFTGDDSYKISSLGAGESVSVEVPVIAAYGGRARITGYAVEGGSLVAKAESEYIDIAGEGYYAGDINTHTSVSASQGDNAKFGYLNGMSYIASTEINAYANALSTDEIATITGTNNGFIDISACYGEGIRHELCDICRQKLSVGDLVLSETMAIINKPLRYMLAYDTDVVPNMAISTLQYHPSRTYQDAVSDVIDAGGLVVVPFFYGGAYDITESINMSKTLSGITGLEVFTPAYPLDSMETKVAMNVWKLYATAGRDKVFATAGSNNVLPEQVGTYFIQGRMNGLSEYSVYDMLRSGDFYFSNGPRLTFEMGGVGMGADFTTAEGASTIAKLYATDENAITLVRLTKYTVVGNKNDIISETVYEEDLTGQGAYIYSKMLEVNVNPNEFYIFDVYTEKSSDGNTIGYASSNPIYSVEPAKDGAKASGLAISDIDYSFAGDVKRADNGAYYCTAGNFIQSLLSVKSKGNSVIVNYHKLNNSEMSDYAIITVEGADGTKSYEKIFIK